MSASEPTGWQLSNVTEAIFQPRYRPSDRRAKVAIVLVAIAVAAGIWEILAVAAGFGLLARLDSVTDQEVDSFNSARTLASRASLLTYVASAIASFAWLSRVVDNVPALGGGQPSVTPRAAILWWFAPISNLFKPYQIVADVWRRLASIPAEFGVTLLLVWWGLFVGSSAISFVAYVRPPSEDIAGIQTSFVINILSDTAFVIAGLLWVWIILGIERRSRVRALKPFAASPPDAPASSSTPPA